MLRALVPLLVHLGPRPLWTERRRTYAWRAWRSESSYRVDESEERKEAEAEAAHVRMQSRAVQPTTRRCFG